jgi:alpha-beta hydrolase superfamily lysophospholipase
MRDRPTSYAAAQGWRRYLPFMPDQLRLPSGVEPEESWWGWRERLIHLDRIEAAQARGTVILVHGVGGYGRIVTGFGAPAITAGYSIVAPDLPGYGLSRAAWRRLTFDTWVDCIRDLATLEQRRTGRPVVLFGLSLGGVVAYHAATSGAPIAGVIATTLADTTDPDVLASYSRFTLVGHVGIPLMRRLRLLTDPVPLPPAWAAKMESISNNPGLAELCTEDALGGGALLPTRFWRTLTSSPPPVQPEHFQTCPLLVAHAGQDRMTEIELTRRFVARMGPHAEFVELDQAGHFPIEQPGAAQLAAAVSNFLNRL